MDKKEKQLEYALNKVDTLSEYIRPHAKAIIHSLFTFNKGFSDEEVEKIVLLAMDEFIQMKLNQLNSTFKERGIS